MWFKQATDLTIIHSFRYFYYICCSFINVTETSFIAAKALLILFTSCDVDVFDLEMNFQIVVVFCLMPLHYLFDF